MGRERFEDPLQLSRRVPVGRRRRCTLADALTALLEQTARRVADRVRSPGTLKMQQQHVRWLRRALGGGRALADIDGVFLERFVEAARERGGRDGDPLNLKTVQKLCTTLRSALKMAHRRGWIDQVPPFPAFCMPPLEARPSVFRTGEDFWRLYRTLRRNRADWMALAFFTAQHAADVERMSWADVDLRDRTMLVRNTKNRRPALRVRMPAPLVALLRARRAWLGRPKSTDPIVPPWQNRAIDLARACIRVGLPPANATALRHAATSAMVRRLGITPAAQKWGGWSSTRMMETVYAHALPAQLNELAGELSSFVGLPPGAKDRR